MSSRSQGICNVCVCVCERGRERESGRVHSNGNCVKACDQTKWCV